MTAVRPSIRLRPTCLLRQPSISGVTAPCRFSRQALALSQAIGPLASSRLQFSTTPKSRHPTATFNLENPYGVETPTLLHHLTPVARGADTLDLTDVPSFEDINNYYWKSPSIQAFLQSFSTGQSVGLIELDRTVFGADPRSDLLARALRYEESWLEQGTESTKALGQVRGSTRKAFPQKGRGKARVGTVRAPQWKGGYRVHGPRPHDKSTDIPRKVYSFAIRSALSAKFRQDQLLVVDSLTLDSDLKATLMEKLLALSVNNKTVYFMYGNEEPEELLIKAAGKFKRKEPVPKAKGFAGLPAEKPLLVSSAREVSVTPLLRNEILVLDKAAVEVLEEMYHQE
ncbi:ribosomal protein L4 domain-containing protein [Fimicolochytrium jonesii]|uniref:ribosomal protein L4 domain-containing protein n=1 Tax=Fimicolochytrium jonesii TaxID=1396493 RepID=UPI0022FDBBDB|nr:ribosomal protein L4 domain-containing protein [Fimicolochytrium jonesii]KAI8824337.1 ribosomal protein L4 domain-containing protein [Fimicolochytrium jonesii]